MLVLHNDNILFTFNLNKFSIVNIKTCNTTVLKVFFQVKHKAFGCAHRFGKTNARKIL